MNFLITRDAYGVPHVQADTASDVWAGMGYACAQDRLFQLDYDRRRACGRWAEIAGPAAVGGDVLARRMRRVRYVRCRATSMAALLSPGDSAAQRVVAGAVLEVPGRPVGSPR